MQTARGIYFIPNEVDPALLSRACNRIRPIDRGEPATSDGNILRRRWLLIDCDPVRPAHISSTADEHEAARDRSRSIFAALGDVGWPQPVVADSGNGYHLLYRIDQLVDDSRLVERCLTALAERFSDAAVTVDRVVHNPARIVKLYGTMACKGDSTEDRPHRISKLVHVPGNIEVVPTELLEALAASVPAFGRESTASCAACRRPA